MNNTDWTGVSRIITAAWEDPPRRRNSEVVEAVAAALEGLDRGDLRVAEPMENGWVVHAWVKEAVLLYFVHRDMKTIEHGPFEYRDKIPLKGNFEKAGFRVVPPATIRYGAYVAPDAVVMPSYINIGARVGEGTMVDTWATVGSCAQIGRGVHLSGGWASGGSWSRCRRRRSSWRMGPSSAPAAWWLKAYT